MMTNHPLFATAATLDEGIALFPGLTAADEGESLKEQALALMAELQTSLDPVELVRTFARLVKESLAHDGYYYSHPAEGIEAGQGLRIGEPLAYELRMGDAVLGELTFYRRRGFVEGAGGWLDRLVWCLVYPLRNALMYRKALRSAYRDPLTGAQNRGAFDQALEHEVAVARRNGTPLSLIVIDIDHFKSINDNFGHAIGDCALRSLVECADETLRGADALYRYGGEEFVILLNNTGLEGARLVAERLRRLVEGSDHHCDDTVLKMTASFGVAQLEGDEQGLGLFRRADAALYRAKQGGRNRVETSE